MIIQGKKQLWPSKAIDVLADALLLGRDALLLVQCFVPFTYNGSWTQSSEMWRATYPAVQSHIPEDHNLQLHCCKNPPKPQKSHRCVDVTSVWLPAIHFVVSDIHGVFCVAGDGATCGTRWTDESSGALVSWRHVSTDTRTHISMSCAHLTGVFVSCHVSLQFARRVGVRVWSPE